MVQFSNKTTNLQETTTRTLHFMIIIQHTELIFINELKTRLTSHIFILNIKKYINFHLQTSLFTFDNFSTKNSSSTITLLNFTFRYSEFPKGQFSLSQVSAGSPFRPLEDNGPKNWSGQYVNFLQKGQLFFVSLQQVMGQLVFCKTDSHFLKSAERVPAAVIWRCDIQADCGRGQIGGKFIIRLFLIVLE